MPRQVHVMDDAVLTVDGDLAVQASTTDRNYTYAVTAAGNDGLLAVSAAVSDEEGETNAWVDGTATVKGDISISATVGKEPIDTPKLLLIPSAVTGVAAASGAGTSQTGNVLDDGANVASNKLTSFLNTKTVKPESFKVRKGGKTLSGNSTPFEAAASVAVVHDVNKASARIGDSNVDNDGKSGEVSSEGSIEVKAKIASRPDVTATASGGRNGNPADTTKFSGSAAIAIGTFTLDAKATIGAGAKVDAARELAVRSNAKNSWEDGIKKNLFNVTKPDFKSTDGNKILENGKTVETSGEHQAGGKPGYWYKYIGATNSINLGQEDFSDESKWESLGPSGEHKSRVFVSNLTGYLDGSLGLDTFILDLFVQALASSSEVLSVAFGIGVIDLNNTSEATIADSAEINQKAGFQALPGDQAVAVEATNVNQFVGALGNLQLPGASTVKKIFTSPSAAVGDLLGTSSDKGAVGAVALVLSFDNTTKAEIVDGVKLYADSLKVDAATDVMNTIVAASGGKAGNIGFNGTFQLTEVDNKTYAQIENGAQVTVGSASVKETKIENGVLKTTDRVHSLIVEATDELDAVLVSGGVSISGSIGVGATVGLFEVDRDTQALIGNRLNDGTDAPSGSVSVGGSALVNGQETGFTSAISLAAAVVTQPPVFNPKELKSLGPIGTNKDPAQSKFGLGASGDVSLNTANDSVQAYINDAGNVTSGGELKLTSNNSTDMVTIAGAVAIVLSPRKSAKPSIGIAGSYSQNTLNGKTLSFITDSGTSPREVEASKVTLTSERKGDLFSLTAGGSGGLGSTAINVAGSVSVNEITNETKSSISNKKLVKTTGQGVEVSATDETDIDAITGGFAISVAVDAKSSTSVAVSISLSKNDTNSTVKATISDTEIDSAGKVDVRATSETRIDALALAGSLAVATAKDSGKSFSVTGAIGLNDIDTVVEASIKNPGGIKDTHVKSGDLTVKAVDMPTIDVEVIGAALSFAGGQSALSIAIGLSFAQNEIDATLESAISKSKVTVDSGSVTVDGLQDSTIDVLSLNAAVAISGGPAGVAVAVAGAVALNRILGDGTASISDGIVTASGNVTVREQNTAEIEAIVPSVSVGFGALGAAVARNLIGWKFTTETSTYDTDDTPTDLQPGNRVAVTTGPLDGGVYEYVGAAKQNVNGINLANQNYGDREAWKQVNLLSDPANIQAFISNTSVTAGGSLQVDADANQTIEAILIAASVAFLSGQGPLAVAAAGVYAENRIENHVKSYIFGSGTDGIKAGTVSVTADDVSGIKAIAPAVAVSFAIQTAGGGGGAVSLAVGLSIANNEIGNQTDAYVSNAAVVQTTAGVVIISAGSGERTLFEFDLAAAGLTTADLERAAEQDYPGDSAQDSVILNKLKQAFINNGVKLADLETVRVDWKFTTADGTKDLKTGDTVKLASDYANGGQASHIYKIKQDANSVDLGAENYLNTSRWELLEPELKLNVVDGPRALYGTEGVAELKKEVKNGDTVLLPPNYANGGQGEHIYTFKGSTETFDLTKENYSNTSRWTEQTKAAFKEDFADEEVPDTKVDLTQGDTVRLSSDYPNGGVAGLLYKFIGVEDPQRKVDIAAEDYSANVLNPQNQQNEPNQRWELAGPDITGDGVPDGDAAEAESEDHTIPEKITVNKGDTLFLPAGYSRGGIAEEVYEFLAPNEDIALYQEDYSETSRWKLLGDNVVTHKFLLAEARLDVGDTVLLDPNYANGGTPNEIYRFKGPQQLDTNGDVVETDLSREDYSSTSLWELVPREKSVWQLVDGGGDTYTLELVDGTKLKVAKANITAVAVAAAVSVAIGTGAGFSAAGGGAVSKNTITTKTNAHVDNSKLTSADDVRITSANKAHITAVVVGAALSIGVGDQGGVGVSIGVAISKNFIGYDSGGTKTFDEVRAFVSESSIQATGDLVQSASSERSIRAFVLAASVAIAGGGEFGVAAAGSGVRSENKIAVDVKATATEDGADGIKSSKATITATDSSTISSFAGSASISAAVSEGFSGSAAVGATIARNSIDNTIEAAIKDAGTAFTTTSGDVTVKAEDKAQIKVIAFAASLAVALGSGGVSLSGAGADARNSILTETNSLIDNSKVTSAGNVDMDAVNNANIKAWIGAFALSLNLAPGAGAAIGVVIARNTIGWESDSSTTANHATDAEPATITKGERVRITQGIREGDVLEYLGDTAISDPDLNVEGSYILSQNYGDEDLWKRVDLVQKQAPVTTIIKDSTVTASAGNVTLDATSTQDIDAFIFAAAGAISGPGLGISGAGTGAVNRIAMLVDAHMEGSTVTSKSATLTAKDASSVKAVVGTVSLAVTLGAGTNVSVGIAKGKNEISNDVKAAIFGSSIVTASSGDLTLQSTENALIKVVTVSVSAAAAFGAGISFSGAGAISKNVINTKTNAFVDGSSAKASADINVLATNTATIDSKVVGVSVGIGGGVLGGAVAIGSAKAENLFGFNSVGSPLAEVQAYIKDSSANAEGNLNIKATNNATIDADVDVDSVAVGFGAASGAAAAIGVDVVNGMAVNVKTYIKNSTSTHIDVTGNTTIESKDTVTVNSDVLGLSIAAAVGAGTGSVSIAISLAKNEVANVVEAFIDSATFDSDSGSMTITANETVTFNSVARAVAAAAGVGAGFSGGGAVSKNILKTATRGYVNNSTVNLGGSLTINSTDLSTSDSRVLAVAASLGFIAAAGSGANATTEITSTTEAYINQSDVVAGGDILVTAAERPDAFGKADGVAIAVGFGGAAGSTDVNTTLQPTVNAWLGTKLTEIKAGGSIRLRALYNVDDNEQPLARGVKSESSATGGSLVGVVGADAKATQKPVVNVKVLKNSRVQASGNIEIKSLSNLELDMDVEGDSGGLVGTGDTNATYTIDMANGVTFEEDTSVESLAGSVTVKAETFGDGIKAEADGATGGLVGVASAEVKGHVTVKTTIDLAERAEVIAKKNLSLETHTKPGMRSDAEVDVGGGFADAETYASLRALDAGGNVIPAELVTSITAAAKSRLTGKESATMKAHVTFIEMVAKTESDAYGLFVDADADSNVSVDSKATILFQTGAAILGKNSLVLETSQSGPDDGILSHASAGAHGIGVSDSDGNNTTTLTTAVTFEGAELTSDDLKTTATRPSDAIYEKLANNDKDGTLTNTSEVTSTGATLDANNGKLTINADKATTDNSSLLKANELAVTAVNDVVLRMNSGSVTVTISGAGDLTISALNNINLTKIDVDDGKADITSRGTIEVTDVDVSKDVNLTSAEALIVSYVKAGDDLTLSAIGAIREPASFDADIDAAGDNVKVTSGQAKPTDGTAIETQGTLTESYAAVNPNLDLSNVNTTGTFIVNATGYSGPVNITTTGTVILIGLAPQPGQAISINAGGDIITDGIDTGTTGSLSLTAGGSFISTGELKGSPVNITAGGITVYEIDTDPTVVNLNAGTGPVELLGPVIADELNVTAGRLTVDVGAVGTFPATFNYTGQTSNDSLDLINGTPGDVSYNFTGSSTGTLSSDGNTINHTSVEVITDSQVSTNRTFSFTSSNADTITLGDDGVTDGVTKLSSASSGATVFFTNSVETFTLNTGDGDDHVTIHNFDVQDGQGNTYGGTVTVNGEDGNDTLDGVSSTYPLNLGGGIGDDSIAGGSNVDNIAGGEGEDEILGRDGNDRVVGDKARFNSGIDFTAVNSLTITSFEAFGNSDDDVINGGAGDDILVGGVGQDTITGEDGNDILIGDNAIVLLTPVFIITTNDVDSVTFVVLGGADTLSGGSGRDVLIGGAGGDTLTGGADADVLIGDQGIYTVEKYETQSFVDGGGNSIGGGQDTLTGEDGNDVVLGGDDQDTINGNDGADILLGDNGQITRDATGASDLTADSNQVTKGDNDTINGGAGDDVIFGGTLVDTISGGEGDDVVYGDHAFADFNDPANPIFASTDTGPDDNTGGDTINGEAGDDILHGQRGDDTISGGDGEDEIYGGLNDDLINGGAGHDTILGDRGVIVRAVDATGSPVRDANGKWHRDVVTFSGSFEISDLIDIDTTPLFSTAGTEARELLLADLLLAVGNLDGAGTRQMLSNGAWNTDLLVLQALDSGAGHGGDDTLNGDDGDDAIFGQYGDDTLSGNDGDDYLAGGTGQDNLDGGAGTNSLIADTASGVTPFHSQQPANLQGIFISEAAAGVDVTVGTETFAGQMLLGALVFPEVDLMPIIANDMPIMSSFIPESLSVAFDLAKNDSMTGTSDGRLIKGYISAIPDALHHLDQLQASDTITTGSGNDFIVGDSVSTVADFKTNNSTIDNLFKVKVLPALTRLVNHLHETEPLFQTFRKANGLATEPHDIELGNDTINGADGNDFIVGDNVTIVTPVLLGVLGESAETAVQDGLDLVRTLHDVHYVANDLNQVVLDLQNTLFDIIDSTNGRNSIMKLQGDEDLHDIIAGRDTLASGEGEDIVVGDNANFIMPVMTGMNSTERRLDPLNGNVQLVNLDLQLARDYGNHEAAHYDPFNFVRVGQNIRIEFFDEFFGNDTITGNEGNDILVGDYATIGVPIIVDTNDLNNLEDEFRAFDKALGDFEQSIVNRRPERRLDHTLESGLDAISGGDGNDTVFGDYVRIIRPITTTGTVYRDFTFSVSETGYLPFMRSRGRKVVLADDVILGGDGSDTMLGQRGTNFINSIENDFFGDTRDLVITGRLQDRVENSINTTVDNLISKLIATGSTLNLEGEFNLKF